ncbi:hypothetical protein WN55_01550 [Dufourea novaeangliae]|uniref:Uncharacterized protein n=1 Tax=Dufourea novaeangliae TaxID=178035 RepID=A0A154PG74_DUFNO|nr:hypothetical protein WN55_01550 [Dufourea novaeangliae]
MKELDVGKRKKERKKRTFRSSDNTAWNTLRITRAHKYCPRARATPRLFLSS